jgi:hypothetical protein
MLSAIGYRLAMKTTAIKMIAAITTTTKAKWRGAAASMSAGRCG